ncbi:MAG: hypothetical protein HYY34_00585 [Chloroflexi bacterium]|nr:hypothetical protein [Chloroflexota bacterium]
MQTEIEKRPPVARRFEHVLRLLRTPLTLIALILVGYLVLGVRYVQENRKIADLQYRADANRAALLRPPPEVSAAEADLVEAQATLEALKTGRVTTIPEEELVQLTLLAASQTGVAVTSAGTRSDTFVQKEGEKVRVTPFFIRATGNLDQIQAFLAAMEFGRVETLELQSALVTEEKGIHALTLAAVIYSHLPLDDAAQPGAGKGTPTPTPKAQKGG